MSSSVRVLSLDQFRGYCVLGMFVVNFVGVFAATHHLLRHNNTHFSYADSIMPGFILISGFSFRMTFMKRLASQPASSVRRRFIGRSIGLIALSLMFFGLSSSFKSYQDLTAANGFKFLAELVKANAWEVLAIIGACQIILLPFIAWTAGRRWLLLLGLGVLHLLLSGWFNWDFVYGRPNWLDDLLGTQGKRAWDGGFFGLIAWSEIMLIGTLLPDLVESTSKAASVRRLVALGGGLMLAGYAASCLTRLYDIPVAQGSAVQDQAGQTESAQGQTAQGQTAQNQISSYVWPPLHRIQGRSWADLLAEPPLVPPPGKDLREPNYWAMDKRIVSQSFVMFAAGFAVFVYGLFVWVCDLGGWSWKPLHTFGQNPLAAYVIHHTVEKSLMALFPKDATAGWAAVGMLISIAITYKFVRFLEDKQLYLRL